MPIPGWALPVTHFRSTAVPTDGNDWPISFDCEGRALFLDLSSAHRTCCHVQATLLLSDSEFCLPCYFPLNIINFLHANIVQPNIGHAFLEIWHVFACISVFSCCCLRHCRAFSTMRIPHFFYLVMWTATFSISSDCFHRFHDPCLDWWLFSMERGETAS